MSKVKHRKKWEPNVVASLIKQGVGELITHPREYFDDEK